MSNAFLFPPEGFPAQKLLLSLTLTLFLPSLHVGVVSYTQAKIGNVGGERRLRGLCIV